MEIDPKILCGVSALVVVVCLYHLYSSESFQSRQKKFVTKDGVLSKGADIKKAQRITIPDQTEKTQGRIVAAGQKKGTQGSFLARQTGGRARYSAEEFGYGYDF